MTAAPAPFGDPALVRVYEAWYEGPGRRADRLEKALLRRLLGWISAPGTLLEVAAGTGHFARFFEGLGWRVTGFDLSAPMLVEAVRLGSRSVVLGDAHRLPFGDCSFDVAAVVAALGFLSDPELVLSEAVRVSRRGVLVGALNRSSRLGRRVRRAVDEPWRSARLLGVGELRRRVAAASAGIPRSTVWRTTLWPVLGGAWRAPWGDFIGLGVRWRREREGRRPK